MQLEGRFAICNKAEEGPIPTSAEVETEEGLDSGPTGRMAFAPSPWLTKVCTYHVAGKHNVLPEIRSWARPQKWGWNRRSREPGKDRDTLHALLSSRVHFFRHPDLNVGRALRQWIGPAVTELPRTAV